MQRNLARELELLLHPPRATGMAIGNYDPSRTCEHTPDQAYTRHPCSCGRELWPPRGRGRGEDLYSPRRIAAKFKALKAMELHLHGWTYQRIALKLGYKDASGPWRAVQRIRDQEAAWSNYEQRTGHHLSSRHQPTPAEFEQALEDLKERINGNTLDNKRLGAARERLRRLLLDTAR